VQWPRGILDVRGAGVRTGDAGLAAGRDLYYPLVTVAASVLLLGRLQNAVRIVAGVALTVAGVGLLLAGAV
jgi:hypothetical protein